MAAPEQLSTELLFELASDFRDRAQGAWSRETAFPGLYDADNPPRGQGGVTSYAMGQWLAERHGFSPDNLFYTRGHILRQVDRPDQKRGDISSGHHNHAWLGVYLDGVDWQVDVTADQFDGIFEPVLVQPKGEYGSYPALHVPEAHRITPIMEYDEEKFGRRLPAFLGALGVEL